MEARGATNSSGHIDAAGNGGRIAMIVPAAFLALLAVLLLAPAAVAAPMYILQNDAVGGDCNLIGTWNDLTDTCTLDTGIAVVVPGDTAIEIVDSGITLDGNGYAISGLGATFPPPSPTPWVAEYAVRLNGVFDTEVRNLVVTDIDEGISVSGGGANLIVDNLADKTTRGIILASSTGNDVIGNSCSESVWTCVDVVASGLNTVEDNTATGSGAWGIRLFEGHNNSVARNALSNKGTAAEGAGMGIWVFYADGNTIEDNRLESFGWGVYVSAGMGANNYLTGNFFLGNATQAEGNGLNFFSLPAPTGGNLWDDFDEPAEGCFDIAPVDGFCDAPYLFTGNQDDLPLTGRPQLSLGYEGAYWESFAAYMMRLLSVDYRVTAGGAVDAMDARVLGSVNTGGVTDASALPLVIGDIAAGADAPFTLVYNVPMGIMFFRSTVYLSAENFAGITYYYPEPLT